MTLCEAATAGPWFKTDGIHALYVSTNACMDVIAECEVARDATFIAEARTGWPHAIRRAMAAEAEVERLRAVLEQMDDRKNPMMPRSQMARIAKEALDYATRKG
ncbi:hypothetical protein [Paenibacillus planticolens]|uniref:hypothetical protein n=1 Tax=Paenibacillus planticolens TaxID=2654976 RepID=UPI00149142F1|nr:hypothetical protein [Paenibacillus planticolens]